MEAVTIRHFIDRCSLQAGAGAPCGGTGDVGETLLDRVRCAECSVRQIPSHLRWPALARAIPDGVADHRNSAAIAPHHPCQLPRRL